MHGGFDPYYRDTCRNLEASGQSVRRDNASRSGLVSPLQNKEDTVENVMVSSSVYLDDEAERREQLWTLDKNVIETMTER